MRQAHCRELTEWALPSIALVLMQKCPACLAGYVALATGLGLTYSAAATLRGTLIALCVAALAWLAFRLLRRKMHCHKSTCAAMAPTGDPQ